MSNEKTLLQNAISQIKSGDRIFIHGMGAYPSILIEELVNQSKRLNDIKIVHLHAEGDAIYAQKEHAGHFFVDNLFVGSNLREAVADGRADYIPIFLSEIPRLFRSGAMSIDVALISLSPADKHGYHSMGVSVDAALAAVQSAKIVIAQVNPKMPRTHGDGNLHSDKIHYKINVDQPLPSHPLPASSDIENKIGNLVASLVEDRACLQMGIGGIPNAVLGSLMGHKDLGIHTEMFSDGVIDLYESGVITNSYKEVHPGHIVAGFVSGTQRLYDFVDDNPAVKLMDIGYVNDTSVIRTLSRMTAINSAIEIDITGQVCADSIGTRMFSGVGGQMDFVRGASLSEGGKPIFALPSTTKSGISRISTTLAPGAGVVTTRAHVQYVVTEYGIANLYGKNLRDRATALIQIAHPDHRESLERSAHDRFKR